MTGTSRVLRRLGVAGLGTVVAYAGFVPLTALTAHAVTPFPVTNATTVTLDKHSDTAAVGTCNPFTATVTPVGSSFSVNIQETVPANTAIGGTIIGFCDPNTTPPGNPDVGGLSQPGPTPGTAGTPGNHTQVSGANACSNNTATTATTTDTVSCNTTYTDTNGDGKVTFGVTSNTVGSMSVNVFADQNGNGARDASPAEPGDTATKTWVANNTTGTAANTNKVTCTPTSATNPAGTKHTFVCKVTDANGVALSGQTVNWQVVSGPDIGMTGTCGPTANGAGGTTTGTTPATGLGSCNYTNNGTPGHDVINVWLETNNVGGQQPEEPAAQITKDWVLASPSTSFVSVTCDKNTTATTPNNGPGGGGTQNTSATCQDGTTDKTVVFTATVVNGNPAQPVAGVIVNWSGPVTNASGTGEPANDTESISPTSCTTDATGKCSTTMTDTHPSNGESLTVTATVSRQGGTTTTATGTKNYHDPTVGEARNIAVTPKTAAQPAGGAQTFVATVTDRFGNGVQGVCVGWTETGPGRFTNNNNFFCSPEDASGRVSGTYAVTCFTDVTGQCSEEVTSLNTESGDETVTADIRNTNQDFGSAAPIFECAEPAGQSFGNNANLGGASAADKNATTAGNCSDSGKVTWNANQQGGSLAITSFTNNNPAACSSFTVSGTAPSGATVTLTGFNFRQGTFTIGTATAAANGAWTFTGSGICFNTTVTASTGSGSTATTSNTVTLGFHQVFTNVHFTRVGPYRNGLIEYNVSGSSTSIVGGEPVRVQNSACRSALCGITHMRSSGFTNLHIYLKPGTYTFTLYGTGGSDPQFGGDGHQYVNPQRQTFTVTIH